jgi:hypothetical protein
MRSVWLGSLLALCCLSSSQQYTQEDRFGKSVDQVLAMGHNKWFDWYTDSKRGGYSTAGMSQADQIYAECLGIKTKERLVKASPKDRDFVNLLDERLRSVLIGCVSAGRILTGGGTMWINIGASAEVERQEVLHEIAFGSKSAPKASQDMFWKAYNVAIGELAKNKADIESYKSAEGGYQEAVNQMSDVKNAVALLVPELQKRPDADRRRVLAYCTRMVKMVTLGN